MTKKELKKSPRGKSLLRALHAGGLFRWERPITLGEKAMDVLTHGIGMGLSIAGITILVAFSAVYGNAWTIVSTSIFGVTMFLLYFGSTMCHMLSGQKYGKLFEIWDHIAIYALIAGTYTPFLLVNLRTTVVGWPVFALLWSIVAIGAFVSIKNPNHQPKWVVLLYLFMGWIALFILPWMLNYIPPIGNRLILAGGLSYSIGVIFYLWRRLKFSHAIWHTFVIGGTVLMFFAVLYGSILRYSA